MHKNFKLLIGFAVSLTFTSPGLAQYQDRIVNLNGDTLKCEIKTNFVRTTKYKTPDMADFEKFDEKSVKYFYIAKDNERYRAVIRPGKKKLEYLRLIEEGKICLYEYISSSYMQSGLTQSTTNWFVSKNNDTLYKLKTSSLFNFTSKKDRKDVFSEMLADNPDVLKKYQETDSFSFKNLRNAIHLYNTGQPYNDQRSFVDKVLSPLQP
jgi:hypothetical protein